MKEGFVQSLEIEIEDLEPRAEDCTRLIQNPLVIVKISCDVKKSGSFGDFFCVESMDMEK